MPRLDALSLSRLTRNCKLFRARLSASGLQFYPGIGVCNDKLLVMKCGVAPKHQPTGVTALEFHEQFLVFFLLTLQYVRIQDHPNVVDGILVPAHNSVERPV